MFLYNFFSDKYTLRQNGYDGSDKMSTKQFIFMGILFILIIIISIILRKVKREKLYLIYKIMAIVMPIMEILKIVIETHFDLANGQTFNYGGILPFYTCSMILYFLPFVAWGNTSFKKYSMAFFTSIGLVAGLSNFVYLSAVGWYPLFSAGGLYSALFHAAIVFVGVSLMITGEYKPTFRTALEGMVPVLIFGLLVMPINYFIKTFTNDGFVDYMMLMDGNGFKYIGDFADALGEHGLRPIFSLLMLFVAYPLATFLMNLINMGIIKLVDLGKRLFKSSKREEAISQ